MVTQRRRRAWSDVIVSQALAVNGALHLDLLQNLADSDTKTVARVLLDVVGTPTAADQSEATNFIHMGIGVCSLEAFNATSLPDPDITADYPTAGWLYVATKVVQQGLPVISSGGGVTRTWARFEVDLRAQRKVDRGVLYLTAINRTAEGASMTVYLFGRVRVLCLT